MKNFEGLLNNEVKSRLSDSTWDNNIANKIVLHKKKQQNKIIAISSTSLTVAIISVFTIFSLGIFSSNIDYDKFIAEQVNETFKTVYNSDDMDSYSDEIDSFIATTLDAR